MALRRDNCLRQRQIVKLKNFKIQDQVIKQEKDKEGKGTITSKKIKVIKVNQENEKKETDNKETVMSQGKEISQKYDDTALLPHSSSGKPS